MDIWEEKENYFIFKGEQKSPEWKELHYGRCTGSIIGACVGHSRFDTPVTKAFEILGINEKIFNEVQLDNMNYGIELEPKARKWYEDQYKVKVKEIGMAIPKWNKYFGVSVDGLVGNDGIIEIKCVKKMYKPLIDYTYSKQGISHIWTSHYDQMLLGMAIMEKKWCDYIVFCPNEKKIFVQRVFFNEKDWIQLYNNAKIFVEKYLISNLKKDIVLPPGYQK